MFILYIMNAMGSKCSNFWFNAKRFELPNSSGSVDNLEQVFDGAIPNIAETLRLAGDEHRRWTMAGARGLSHLTAPLKLLVDLQGRFLLSLSA